MNFEAEVEAPTSIYIAFAEKVEATFQKPIYLPRGPARVLAALIAAKGRPVSTQALIEHMYWDHPDSGPLHADKVVHQAIHKIRKQLKDTDIVVKSSDHGYSITSTALNLR